MPDVNPVPSQQPTTTVAPKNPISWRNIIIGVIIGAVLFGGGGYLVYNAYQPKTSEPTVTTTKKATTSAKPATPSAKKDEFAGWKTFSYDSPKISFKYPKDWFINVKPEVDSNGNFTVSVSSYDPAKVKTYPTDMPSKWVLLEVLSPKNGTAGYQGILNDYDFVSSQPLNTQVEHEGAYYIKTKSFKLDGLPAVRYTFEYTPGTPTEYYFRDIVLVKNVDSVWKIDILSPDKDFVKLNSEIFDQILSTFNFL